MVVYLLCGVRASARVCIRDYASRVCAKWRRTEKIETRIWHKRIRAKYKWTAFSRRSKVQSLKARTLAAWQQYRRGAYYGIFFFLFFSFFHYLWQCTPEHCFICRYIHAWTRTQQTDLYQYAWMSSTARTQKPNHALLISSTYILYASMQREWKKEKRRCTTMRRARFAYDSIRFKSCSCRDFSPRARPPQFACVCVCSSRCVSS